MSVLESAIPQPRSIETGFAPAQSRRLLQLGVLLFLIGLLTGFAMPAFANPRMGLASHLEAILNGIFLVVLGLLWERLVLGRGALTLAFGLVIYGTFANWLATFLGALWGAGTMMPLASGEHQGSGTQELIITVLLFSLSFAMIIVSGLVLWGLRSPRASS